MSLVQNYSITCDKSGNYIINFNTSENASVTYTTERDGTNTITVNVDKKGETTFSKNFGNVSKEFKFTFVQPDGGGTMKRQPSGGIGNGGG